MNLLERYLRQIEKYLPFKERKETTDELRSLILDQLDEVVQNGQDEEQALYNIIQDMGDPRSVANNYNERGPMISKEMEPILLLVLKIVSITLPAVYLFANALEYVFSSTSFTFMEFILDVTYNIPGAIYTLVVSIGFIFIFFYLIERFFQPKFAVENKIFVPDLLPEIPDKEFKVTLFESIFTILVTVLFVYLINFQQGLISIYYNGGREPLLNSNFDRVLPFLNIGWLGSIILHIFYAFKQKKTVLSKSIEFLLEIYSGVVLIFLANSKIFNEIILNGYDLGFLTITFQIVMTLLGIAVIIGGIVQYIKMFINLENLEKLDELSKSKKS